jgi:hypothetical protein
MSTEKVNQTEVEIAKEDKKVVASKMKNHCLFTGAQGQGGKDCPNVSGQPRPVFYHGC